MTVTAVRWALIDTLHGYTGLPLPPLDFSRLGKNVAAYELLIEIHYRHYQFYANMFVATAIAYICYRTQLGGVWPLGWPDTGVAVLEVIFFLTSRDTLRKYYTRSRQLLGTDAAADRRPTRGAQEQHAASVPSPSAEFLTHRLDQPGQADAHPPTNRPQIN
jgi:hypothetical protein